MNDSSLNYKEILVSLKISGGLKGGDITVWPLVALDVQSSAFHPDNSKFPFSDSCLFMQFTLLFRLPIHSTGMPSA